MRKLAGKVALITGSTSGIGLAIARVLAGSGADIVFNGMGNAQEVHNIQKEIETAHKVRSIYLPLDLTKKEFCK